jgi:hypothetical protein
MFFLHVLNLLRHIMAECLSETYKLLHTLIYTLKNLPRDIAALALLQRTKNKLAYLDRTHISVSDFYSRWLKAQPNKPCIIFNETTWTFQDVRILSLNN